MFLQVSVFSKSYKSPDFALEKSCTNKSTLQERKQIHFHQEGGGVRVFFSYHHFSELFLKEEKIKDE